MGDGAQGPAPSSCSRIKTSVMGAKKIAEAVISFLLLSNFFFISLLCSNFFYPGLFALVHFCLQLVSVSFELQYLDLFYNFKAFRKPCKYKVWQVWKKSKLNSFLCIPFLMFDQGFGIPGLIKVIKCNQRAFNFGGSFQIEQPSLSKIRAIFRN